MARDAHVAVAAAAPAEIRACRAATPAGAAAAPCVLVVLREEHDHAHVREEIDRLRGVLHCLLESLERLSEGRRAAG